MRNFGRLKGDLDETLDLYFQMCSTCVNTVQLATMAATLANAGINPITEERAISPVSLRDVLTVMFTCGLYEQSGLWAYKVGVPAKSGVSGGFMAVVPGLLGVGVFSPRLNEGGNSVRGIKVCEGLAEHSRPSRVPQYLAPPEPLAKVPASNDPRMQSEWIKPITLGGTVHSNRSKPSTPGLLAAADPQLFVHTSQHPPNGPRAGLIRDIAKVVALPDTVALAIVLADTHTCIGRTTFMDIRPEHRGVEVGRTWIGRAYHGTRVNPEIKLLTLTHAFESLDPPSYLCANSSPVARTCTVRWRLLPSW